MNFVALIGRLTKDPEIRQAGDKTVASYTLAIDGRGEHTDFIRCQAWEKKAEFVDKYLKKGMKIAITGRIQTGSYTTKDGRKVDTFDIVVNDHEFCEKRGVENVDNGKAGAKNDGFIDIPDGMPGLPFN